MRERTNQISCFFMKFGRLFINTGGWKELVFCLIIMLIVTYVVRDGMFVYGSSTQSGCFAIICACIWVGIFNTIQSVCKERKIIKREHRSGLHMSSYVGAKALFELIVCLLEMLITVVISAILLNEPEAGLVFDSFLADYAITVFLILLSSDYLGIAVSAAVKDTTTAMTVMPFILILQLILSGVLFELSGIVSAVANITISKWGIGALGSISNINALPTSKLIAKCMENDRYSYTGNAVMKDWGILLLFCIVYLATATIFLEFIDKEKR